MSCGHTFFTDLRGMQQVDIKTVRFFKSILPVRQVHCVVAIDYLNLFISV